MMGRINKSFVLYFCKLTIISLITFSDTVVNIWSFKKVRYTIQIIISSFFWFSNPYKTLPPSLPPEWDFLFDFLSVVIYSHHTIKTMIPSVS